MNPNLSPSILPAMVIESTTDLGSDAIQNPGKYAGFMGISVGHKFFSKTTMEYFLQWGSKMFSEFLILLMDDPDMYNFKVFENLTETEALNKARIIGDERARSYQKVIRKIGVTNIKIVQFRDFIYTPKYIDLLIKTKEYSIHNQEFKYELLGLMEEGIGGKIEEYVKQKSLTAEEIVTIKETLSGYILEEFVSLLYFTENGYPIEVDPTKEFSTKTMVYNNAFPEFNKLQSLSKRGHIFVHPEGITKSTY